MYFKIKPLIEPPTTEEKRARFLSGQTRLGPRFSQISVMVTEGKMNKEIAADLGLTTKSVDHMSRIFEQTGAKNRADLTSMMFRQSALKEAQHA